MPLEINEMIDDVPSLTYGSEKDQYNDKADQALYGLISIISDKCPYEVCELMQPDFKSAHHILKANPEQLSVLKSKKAVRAITLINDLIQSIAEAQIRETERISSYTAVTNYLRTILLGNQSERLICLYLDNRNNLIKKTENIGTLDRCPVYPREVIKTALMCGAKAIILAHQHPSGCHEFSEGDKTMTDKIKAVADPFDIKLYDHFLIADNEFKSMKSLGLL